MTKPTQAKTRTATKPRRLGRGLSTLLSEPVDVSASPGTGQRSHALAKTPPRSGEGSHGLRSLPLDEIVPGRGQPRQSFDEAALARLAQSIGTAGVMQPIVVRPIAAGADAPSGARWELIAGERRWRAARLAGLASVPAVVADLADRDAAEWSLVENLQREDLNPIERAEAFRRLQRDFGLTQAEIAARVGLERSSVSNLIRLFDLEELIRDEIAAGRLTPGHGKALLALAPGKGRVQTALRARDGGWSVRRLEQHVQRTLNPLAGPARAGGAAPVNPSREAARRDLERRLRDRLGTKVHVHLDGAGLRGRIIVDFFDLDQLDGLLTKIGVPPGGIG